MHRGVRTSGRLELKGEVPSGRSSGELVRRFPAFRGLSVENLEMNMDQHGNKPVEKKENHS